MYEVMRQPLSWKAPRLIFVDSMSDLFHEDIPLSFIQEVFQTMANANRHTFQVLTKRVPRLVEVCRALPWPDNVWVGASVETAEFARRAEDLRRVPSRLRFLSVEPLLGPIPQLELEGIGWVIVGGESGPGARPMQTEWVREIRDACVKRQIPFFFKQWGGVHKGRNGRLLDGRTWEQMPRPTHSLTERA